MTGQRDRRFNALAAAGTAAIARAILSTPGMQKLSLWCVYPVAYVTLGYDSPGFHVWSPIPFAFQTHISQPKVIFTVCLSFLSYTKRDGATAREEGIRPI